MKLRFTNSTFVFVRFKPEKQGKKIKEKKFAEFEGFREFEQKNGFSIFDEFYQHTISYVLWTYLR